MKKEAADNLRHLASGVLAQAFAAAPHPLLKGAVFLLGVAFHLKVNEETEKPEAEKEVKGERVR